MTDLIDRDALIAEYDRVHVGAPGGARKLMVDAPRVDAAPVSHGHWIIKDTGAYCSACNKRTSVTVLTGKQFINWVNTKEAYKKIKFAFCPFCGAMMDEEDIEWTRRI